MGTELTRFQVIGLHGAESMDVHLDGNKLILVGENGTGKSTFVNLIYYFLTQQWRRLNEYRFARIRAHFGDQQLTITPDDVEKHLAARSQFQGFMDLSHHSLRQFEMNSELVGYFDDLPFDSVNSSEAELAETLAAEYNTSVAAMKHLLSTSQKLRKGKPTQLQSVEQHLSQLDLGQFLYLPTYRRIEQDLRSIFRGANIERDLRRFRKKLVRRPGAPFIELVEFGMEDVEQTITARMAQIKESVRQGLDNLTGTYLRDVIRGVHTAVTVANISEVDPNVLDAIFARIDETTLPATDKTHLKKKVATITANNTIEAEDKVTAHFLLKLIKLYGEQQANEKSVRDFVLLCNRYLTAKQLVYDNTNYTIVIQQMSGASLRDEAPLEMQSLSSGEKQIVSLFAHLYLSGQQKFFVVIDEPELSLSVPWQRRFLPDIVETGMCSGLVAVTHSPFVWENDLEVYVRALAEFTVPYELDEPGRSGLVSATDR